MKEKCYNHIHSSVYSVIAGISIFIIDLNLELGIAGGVPYLIVIFLMSFQKNTSYIFYAAIITSVLTLLGFYFSPSGGTLYKVITNRFLALLVIWTSYYFVIRILKSQKEKLILEKKFNHELQKRNSEKEILLKEIHHRVKNNLQVITGLLSLQAAFVKDSKTKSMLSYSQYRINSMAMIHEMLYKTENLTSINFQKYLEQLISDLCNSFKGSNHNINIDIESKISLNIDTAIPLGLLVNEVVTNSLKYAFDRESNKGSIKLEIKPLAYPNFIMNISDDGKGFTGIDFRNSNSLGIKLIHKLALQLNGNIEKDNSQKGTHYILTFKEITQIS